MIRVSSKAGDAVEVADSDSSSTIESVRNDLLIDIFFCNGGFAVETVVVAVSSDSKTGVIPP